MIPVHQSGYRKLHSTDPFVKFMMILSSVPVKAKHLLILLDLSAAFDVVDHGISVEELFQRGRQDSALALLKSYLENRYQQIVIGNTVCESLLQCGVPQGSVLGPILFLVYTHSLALLLASHGVDGHSYADDCRIYQPIVNIDETKTKVLALLPDIKTWMNESKTEIC